MAGVAEPLTAKYLSSAWAAYLFIGGEIAISEMDTFIFSLSHQGVRLEEWGKGLVAVEAEFVKNMDDCLTLLTNLLCYNGLESIDGLDATPLDLVSGIHRGFAHGAYPQILMLGALVSVKRFLSLAQY